MKTIGIISDTHGSLDPRAYAALATSDVIIHAGDICGPAILRELETLAPVIAVRGNNDFDEYGPEVGLFAQPVIEGLRFLISHYPEDVAVAGLGSRGIKPGDPIPDICIHGHTHVPKLLRGSAAAPAQLVLCPGSSTRALGGSVRSVAFMQVEEGRMLKAWIESLDGEIVLA